MEHKPQATLADHLRQRITAEWRWTTALLLAAVFTLNCFGSVVGLHRLNNILHDTLARPSVYQTTPHATDIVIVAIDDNSIEKLGFWPWRRQLHAKLIQQLHQARSVGIDLLMSEHNPAYPDDDALLARAIQEHGRVVLAYMLGSAQEDNTMPVAVLNQSTDFKGVINIQVDSDGILRSVQLHDTVQGKIHQHFVPILLQAAGNIRLQTKLLKLPAQPLRIPWAGPAQTFETVPYHKVLDGSVPPAFFKDKYVLIGAWSSGLGDVFATPTMASAPPMAGVEVLANVLHAALANRWIHSPSDTVTGLLLLLPVFLACLACRFLSPQRAFLACIGLLGAILLVSMALLAWGLWWVGPSAGLLGCALAYPIWSWRSQHAVLAHINDELSLLDTDALQHNGTHGSYSRQTLMNRVAQLHQAIETFRQTRQRRDETMRFLSHDMRAPLNSILALCEMQRHAAEPDVTNGVRKHTQRLEHYARQTLTLVDSLVDLGRAEGKPLARVRVDLAAILRQSCDNMWARAKEKDIAINCPAVENPVWTMAEPALLERVFNNLIDNAIKYSPAGSTVDATISSGDQVWILKIQDNGAGIPAEALGSIFEPFQRQPTNGAAASQPRGAGLGLAFVQIVIRRHHGNIAVSSEPGQGTVFTIRLPKADPAY